MIIDLPDEIDAALSTIAGIKWYTIAEFEYEITSNIPPTPPTKPEKWCPDGDPGDPGEFEFEVKANGVEVNLSMLSQKDFDHLQKIIFEDFEK